MASKKLSRHTHDREPEGNGVALAKNGIDEVDLADEFNAFPPDRLDDYELDTFDEASVFEDDEGMIEETYEFIPEEEEEAAPRPRKRRQSSKAETHRQRSTASSKDDPNEWADAEVVDPISISGYALDPSACSATLLEDNELMMRLASAAARTEHKTEAANLIIAIVPLALRSTPHVYRALWRVLPGLIRGAGRATRTLHNRPHTRSVLKQMPSILHTVVAQLAQRVTHGRPVSTAMAEKLLSQHVLEVARRQSTRRTARTYDLDEF